MKGLSQRQRRILAYIDQHLGENGLPPTVREIGQACLISSTSVVNYNLNRLQDRGYITITPGISRGIQRIGAGASNALAQALVRSLHAEGRYAEAAYVRQVVLGEQVQQAA